MIEDEMREALAPLDAKTLEILDESEAHRGHGGWREGGQTHFRIVARAEVFREMTRVKRHRHIYTLLGDIVPRIHALELDLDAPADDKSLR